MMAGLLASCLAVFVAVRMQYHCFFHVRPLLDTHLAIHVLNPNASLGIDRLGSFPSDTITFFAAMAMILCLENGLYGALAFLWVLVLSFVKVMTGWHYPSDVLAGIVLGSGAVLLISRTPWLPRMLGRLTIRLPRVVMELAVMFFLMDAYTLFSGLQGVLHYFKRI